MASCFLSVFAHFEDGTLAECQENRPSDTLFVMR